MNWLRIAAKDTKEQRDIHSFFLTRKGESTKTRNVNGGLYFAGRILAKLVAQFLGEKEWRVESGEWREERGEGRGERGEDRG